MSIDWREWHDLYETAPAHKARLALVRQEIDTALRACAPGRIRVLSLCAGDGRDVIGTLAQHPRAEDVDAHLFEINAELVAQGREVARAAGVAPQVEFHCADATLSDNYVMLAPADVVLVAGIFGNLTRENVARLISYLPALCKPGAPALWTRYVGDGNGVRAASYIRACMKRNGLCHERLVWTNPRDFVVGTNVFEGTPTTLLPGIRLFEFTGYYLNQAQ